MEKNIIKLLALILILLTIGWVYWVTKLTNIDENIKAFCLSQINTFLNIK